VAKYWLIKILQKCDQVWCSEHSTIYQWTGLPILGSCCLFAQPCKVFFFFFCNHNIVYKNNPCILV
jgi:hypothetical protein